ncbi:kinetochore Sim4 complex subunit Fta4 [Stachybotrys elegans]|uniref:Kinetochore Sim4 complex subunit Fta4 n=1 Tax=Stachybotrys elegans TaxID=80388 RepID=A0A8K0SP95_9HYPO|nr:kinetochore Sim4 complex subunit Fta4 [Stachybotrys elegans]
MASETDSAPTVTALKVSFLSTQANLLSQPVAPSRAWHAANDASDRRIPRRELDFNLDSLNQAIAQHCRRVYAPQAARHVAEQINALYLAHAERRVGDDEHAVDGISRELDFVESKTIDALPREWPLDKDVTALPAEAKRYTESVDRLRELNEQRDQLKLRVERLRRIKAAVDPLQATDDGAGVQENLLTREGPVETELERMRILLARVAGRVGKLPPPAPSGTQDIDVEALVKARKRTVDEFLADSTMFKS